MTASGTAASATVADVTCIVTVFAPVYDGQRAINIDCVSKPQYLVLNQNVKDGSVIGNMLVQPVTFATIAASDSQGFRRYAISDATLPVIRIRQIVQK